MKLQLGMDKSAMGLSLLCLVHCLVVPSAAVLLPTMLAMPLQDELFHQILLLAVVPLSAVALLMGCRKHQTWSVLAWGSVGLFVLIFAGLFGHDLVGEAGERLGTAIGSAFIIGSHYKNYRLCRSAHHCEC